VRKHTKIYLDYFDYGYHQDVWIPCEVCDSVGTECRAVDIHHLSARGMGGSKTKDVIENLIGLCRPHHERCEANPEFNDQAIITHLKFMKSNGN